MLSYQCPLVVPEFPPLSGLAKYNDDTYITVSDEKDNTSPRVFFLEFLTEEKQRFYPINIEWGDELAKNKPTDIESVCYFEDQIWILESGPYADAKSLIDKQQSRLISLELVHPRIPLFSNLKPTYRPNLTIKMPNDVVNIESMDCWSQNGQMRIITAERGSESSESLISTYEVQDRKLVKIGVPLTAPKLDALKTKIEDAEVRWLSDLDISQEWEPKTVWAVGALDTGESTTMSGVLYQLGSIDKHGTFKLKQGLETCRLFANDKPEGLVTTANPAEFLVVSDNEDFGRVLLNMNCAN
ncbi:MAG: hypothetical protein O2971_19390 [Proteobacteria bacterium]|nr:hypothetical protein [Pseudomonadota bacterium]